MAVYLTTTGSAPTVTIADLGARTFTHPVTDYPLTTEYTEDEIQRSGDLQAEITAGTITLKDDDGNIILTLPFATYHTHFEASTSSPGFMPALSGNPDEYLDGDGNWTVPTGGEGDYEVDQLSYTDTVNKVIGPLAEDPRAEEDVNLYVVTGSVQRYGSDYTVREVVGGSAPGYYICIGNGSTAPGGGSFSGGSNPGTGIDSDLTSGDVVRATYPASA